jgi:hypothetical protein
MTASAGRGRALTGGVVAAVLGVLSACALPAPSPTSAPASAGADPPASTTRPSGARSSPTADAIQLHYLDSRYVPAGSPTSANGQLLWTAGEVWPSEIWRFVPGALEPERLFSSPRESSNITAVAASSSGYAFVELSEPAYGKGGWRTWFLSGPGEVPVELDRGRAKDAGFAPTIAIDDERVVWAGFDEPASGAVSRLSMASIGDLDVVTELMNVPIREGLIWYPTVNGDELWYGIIRADFDLTGVGDEYHVETLDLANPDASPVRFAGSANDFNPAVNDAFVVWKTTDDGDAALNWGTLHVMDRRTDAVATIPVTNGNRPSIGDRYVAFEEISHRRLVVYDPVTGDLLDLAQGTAQPAVSYGGQSLSGRLLTFYRQGGGALQIGWAILPE